MTHQIPGSNERLINSLLGSNLWPINNAKRNKVGNKFNHKCKNLIESVKLKLTIFQHSCYNIHHSDFFIVVKILTSR